MTEHQRNNSEVRGEQAAIKQPQTLKLGLAVQPVCLDEQHKGVNHDQSAAKPLALRLDRYVAGNSHALAAR